MSLADYVMKYAQRGPCTCGRCADAPPEPEKHQPGGHTVDMMFFKVSVQEGPARKSSRGWQGRSSHNGLTARNTPTSKQVPT